LNIFYFKLFLKLQINITQHLYNFYYFFVILKGGEILYTYYQKTMSISNMFIYKLLYEKKKKKFQDIIVVQMYEIMKIQMH